MKTYPNQLIFPRDIGADEVLPIAVTMQGLVSTDTNEIVSVNRYPVENDSSATDLKAQCSIATNVVTVGRVFLSTETDRPVGTYRLEIKAQKQGSSRIEIANVIAKVVR